MRTRPRRPLRTLLSPALAARLQAGRARPPCAPSGLPAGPARAPGPVRLPGPQADASLKPRPTPGSQAYPPFRVYSAFLNDNSTTSAWGPETKLNNSLKLLHPEGDPEQAQACGVSAVLTRGFRTPGGLSGAPHPQLERVQLLSLN